MPLDGRHCPECGESLGQDARKCACGWAPKAVGKAYAEPADLNRFRCEWEANGERCHNPGTSTTNTLGGGPWFCSPHFGCSSGALGQAIVEESRDVFFPDYTAKTMYESSLAAYLARPMPGVPGGKPVKGSRFNRDALPFRQREPGEEG